GGESELIAHNPERAAELDLDTAGFPATKPAAASQQLPLDETCGDEVANRPTADCDPAPRLTGCGRPGKRLVADPAPERSPLTPPSGTKLLCEGSHCGRPSCGGPAGSGSSDGAGGKKRRGCGSARRQHNEGDRRRPQEAALGLATRT